MQTIRFYNVNFTVYNANNIVNNTGYNVNNIVHYAKNIVYNIVSVHCYNVRFSFVTLTLTYNVKFWFWQCCLNCSLSLSTVH